MSHPQLNGMSFVITVQPFVTTVTLNPLQCFDIWMHGSAEDIKYNYI